MLFEINVTAIFTEIFTQRVFMGKKGLPAEYLHAAQLNAEDAYRLCHSDYNLDIPFHLCRGQFPAVQKTQQQYRDNRYNHTEGNKQDA